MTAETSDREPWGITTVILVVSMLATSGIGSILMLLQKWGWL